MENAESILIIILSVTLTVFLLVAIVFIASLIKFISYLRIVAAKAEQVVDNVESASAVLKNVAGPLAVGKFFSNVVDIIRNKRKG